MDKLQKAFNRALVEYTPQIKAGIVRKKLEELGVTVTAQQALEFFEKVKEGKFTIDLEDEQVDRAKLPGGSEQNLIIEFTGDELDEFKAQLPEVVEQAIDRFAKLMLRRIRKDLTSHAAGRIEYRDAFNQQVWRHWKKPLELFHVYLASCNEAAAEFNRFYRRPAARKNDLVFDVLIRLQARGSQIAMEVLTLLEAGLADGAHARWRSLHEVTCVAMLIKQHGQDLANRYLLHDFVQSYKSAKRYERWSTALQHRPLSKRTLTRQEQNCKKVIKMFGANFEGEYGWAAKALGNKNPRFADIEKAVGLEKLRPYYRMASDNVHANARALRFKLGLPEGEMLLAGPSSAGLADPGDGAAMSLFQLTTTLLTSKPNIDSMVRCAIIADLRQKVGNEFLKADRTLKKNRHSFGERL